ncbi:hypothetical protein AMAG_14993 [Allomyces macrogynus ATCC 38327]|uniref:MCM AAA-lid domain-containing protein n=1 Tax=Allomyces macrogynus (strain ATCC 38327) TaxID=578462 RepID=A0A0L0T7W4_ALLM3|nr:hypothetical protein AMAG_14993 [Allomyces macrogynus ATCC 38327]|eukprot:KNE70898.1 hypothetical protein AMAG_14993 [Allomyces macrogynus ATCC 38327]
MPPENGPGTIPQDQLKKYIMYARDKVTPKLHQMDENKVSRLYGELRRESLQTGSIPITVRHLDSMIRVAEAHARMYLRDHVRADGIDMAISVMINSFIPSQKYTVMRTLHKSFVKYIRHHRDSDELLLFCLNELVREAVREAVRMCQLAHRSGLAACARRGDAGLDHGRHGGVCLARARAQRALVALPRVVAVPGQWVHCA